jgi:hypothetical protein
MICVASGLLAAVARADAPVAAQGFDPMAITTAKSPPKNSRHSAKPLGAFSRRAPRLFKAAHKDQNGSLSADERGAMV